MTPRTVADLDHEELATLAKEHLLAGQLIDRAGMPTVIKHGVDVMRDVAIDEWMAASPLYSKRMQRLLGFEGDTVETCFKGMQLDIGAPPEFMDFRFSVIDDHHGEFHLDHCGALMDVEPMGDEFVVAMCHHIEDPTFDATGWATNPRLRMRPVHRPPRSPADRHPHCAWTVTIDDTADPTPAPEPATRLAESLAASLPLATIASVGGDADGMDDYAKPLDADLHLRDFATPTLRAIVDEVCLQGHLLVMGFAMAVEARFGTEFAVDAADKQFTGVAGVVAERLRRAFGLGTSATDVATVFSLHPAFHPRTYVDWRAEVDGDVVRLSLGDCPARDEKGFESWITLLAHGHDRALSAIAAGVDPHWGVRADGPCQWVVEPIAQPAKELSEVTVTKFSSGVTFGFDR
ncbi:MAG: hypothetical protein JOZ37_20130 [Actinobacteria bacterium]|nr:hypothetical protein [Actinomycetota bacterium]MBV9255311.1 hypothetical protein [Actinomycetota bacterium]MBV9666281.1 hypothetical protein [Actinomycetota bacterium]MBV9935125.1 hypothetical protein [Actinomycetota bacterium]